MVSILRIAVMAILAAGAQNPTRQQLTVTVTDTAGSPISDATITLTQGNTQRTLSSGPDGTAQSLDLALGEWTLTVRKDGFAAKERPVVVQGVPVNITIDLDLATLRVDVEGQVRVATDAVRLDSAATGGTFVDVPIRDLPATLTIITQRS